MTNDANDTFVDVLKKFIIRQMCINDVKRVRSLL